MFNLHVIESFLNYAKGDIITDAKLVKQLLESEWQNHFVKVAVPASPK